MIRLSRIALGPMRQRTCITLHHAVQLHPRRRRRRRTCTRPRELDRTYVYMYVRRRGTLGSHVIMVITPTIGSSALATHESTIHAAHTFCITPTLGSAVPAEYFRMRSRDEGVIPRSLRPRQPPSCDRESRSRL